MHLYRDSGGVQLWEGGKRGVCALRLCKEKWRKREVCTKNDSFFIGPSPSLSSSDELLFTRELLSCYQLWAMRGQLQCHHQPLDSSLESSAEHPLLEREQISRSGACTALILMRANKVLSPATIPFRQRPNEGDVLKKSIGLGSFSTCHQGISQNDPVVLVKDLHSLIWNANDNDTLPLTDTQNPTVTTVNHPYQREGSRRKTGLSESKGHPHREI